MNNQIPIINRVLLKNFYLFKFIDIPFKKGITILTGRNGVGKSLLIDAIRLGLGLNARSVRMDTINEYIRKGEKEATIIIELSNPKINGNRFIFNLDIDFNKMLDHDSIQIKRIIRFGRTDFALNNKILNSTKKKLLFDSLAQIGIDPNDELAFVPAEDFMPFIRDNPKSRFQQIVEKLHLRESKEQYLKTLNKVIEKLHDNENFKRNLENKIIANKEYEYKHKLWIQKLEIEKELKDLIYELEWTPIKNLREEINTIEKKISSNKNQLKSNKDLLNENESQQKNKDEELNKFKVKLLQIENEFQKIKSELDEKKNNITHINKNIETFQKNLIDLENFNITNDNYIKKLQEEINDLKSKRKEEIINNLKSQKEEIINKKQIIIKSIQDLEIKRDKKIQELDEILKNKQDELIELEKEKEIMRKQFHSISEKKTIIPNYILDFKKLIKDLKFRDSIDGPIGYLIKIRNGQEEWINAVSNSIGTNLLYTFLAYDENALNYLIERRNEFYKKYPNYNINIGFIKKGSKLKSQIKLPEINGIYDYLINTIECNDEILCFISDMTNDPILINDMGINIRRDIINQLKIIKDLNKKPVISKTGKYIEGIRGESFYSYSLPQSNYLIGPLKTVIEKIDDYPGYTKIIEKIKNTEREINNIKNEKEKIYKSIDQEIRKKTKESGFIEKEEKIIEEKLTNEIYTDEKYYSEEIIKKEKKIQEIIKKKQENTGRIVQLEENIKSIKNEKKNIQLQITPLEEKYNKLKLKYNKNKEDYKNLEDEFSTIKNQGLNYKNNITKIKTKLIEYNNNLKKKKEELNKIYSELMEKFKKEPENIRDRTTIDVLINSKKNELNRLNKNVSKEDEAKYKKWIEEKERLDNELKLRMEEYKKLNAELPKWKKKWTEVFTEKISNVEYLFKEMLKEINANGRIEIVNIENPNEAEIYFWVKFFGNDERTLEKHSTGQRQAALIALSLALQSQSRSGIVVIDEFDKGLDTINRSKIIQIIPKLVKKASELIEKFDDFHSPRQFILVCPEINKNDITDEINYLHVSFLNSENISIVD
ncbi:MAG: AAA family ATPase [Candidatus Helarchaeota archaeon]